MNPNSVTHNGESPISQLQESARRVTEEFGKAGRLAKEAAEEQVAELSKVGEDQLQKVVAFARERPITSILIGSIVGYCAARLLRH